MHGWSIGASFQRALLCDIRVAAEGARFMLPEVGHGVIPDTGGVARLFQMCGHGVAADMVLTGRPMSAEEARAYGVVSRILPADQLQDTAMKIAAAPAVTVKMARRVLGHLAEPEVRTSMAEELIAQTFISRSDDMAELRAARAEEREPRYTGS
jgi:enoyl-CoA hydratase/carnithine racemase